MSNSMYTFNWAPERFDMAKRWVHDEAANVRVVRRVIPLFGEEGEYLHSIPDNKIELGPPLTIRPGKTLTPIELAVSFRLEQEQREDELAVHTLSTRAAYILALAEDAVCLGGILATDFLKAQNVEERGLGDQEGLFKEEPKELAQGVLESFLEALEELRDNNHHGPFRVIVTPALWTEALTPRTNTVDAPIYEICPHLGEGCPRAPEGGFVYSPAILELKTPGPTTPTTPPTPPTPPAGAPTDEAGTAAGDDAPKKDPNKRAGLVVSIAGATVGMNVSVDSHVELSEVTGGHVDMRVVEQFRLRLSDPTAVVAMK